MSWFWRRRSYERDLHRELEFHLDQAVRDGLREGLTAEESLRRARMELGGVEPLKEAIRDTRPVAWLEQWWQDTRFALRGMARTPGFTAAAVLTLALGIGANTAVWSVLNGLMFRSLPIERPEELHILHRYPPGDEDHFRFSHPGFERLQAAVPGVGLAAMTPVVSMYATIAEQPEVVQTQLVTGTWFSVLGVGTALGRPLGPEDTQALGGHPVAVISDGFWTRRFGRDPAVLGRTLRLGGQLLTIVGVMQPGFSGLIVGDPADLWVPVVMQHQVNYRADASNDDSDTEQPWVPQNGITWLRVVARFPPADLPNVVGRLTPTHRIWLEEFLGGRDAAQRDFLLREVLAIEPIPRGLSSLSGFEDPVLALMGGVGLVLLIACANLASLLLARSVGRTREMAVRVSLGARPGRLIRQTLTESMTLAVMGGTLGLVLAGFGARALLRLASSGPDPIPLDLPLDLRVLGFALGVTLLTGLSFGLAPAVRTARTDLHGAFKTGGRVTGDRSRGRIPLGRALVVSQIALSLVLAAGASLFVRTLRQLLAVDPGYQPEQVVRASINTRAAGYSYADLPGVYQRLLAEVQLVPGVRSGSISMHGFGAGLRRISELQVPGKVRDPSWNNQGQEIFVTPAFFATVGLPLLRGRGFTDNDRTPGNRVAIVSESLARHFFDTVDVVGQRIGYGTPAEFEILGVVRDARPNSLKGSPARIIYYPMAQGPEEYATGIEVRVAGPPERMIGAIRAAIARVDRGLPIGTVTTLDDLLGRGLQSERLVASLAGIFSLLALLLAGVGLYGVVAYSVTRRTNEMGVRLALGARPGTVRMMVLRDCWILVTLGIVAGAVLWLPVFSVVRNLVYGVPSQDLVSPLLGAAVLALVGTAAAALPAWRASRIDPASALRAE